MSIKYQMTSILNHAPETEAKRELIEASRPPIHEIHGQYC